MKPTNKLSFESLSISRALLAAAGTESKKESVAEEYIDIMLEVYPTYTPYLHPIDLTSAYVGYIVTNGVVRLSPYIFITVLVRAQVIPNQTLSSASIFIEYMPMLS